MEATFERWGDYKNTLLQTAFFQAMFFYQKYVDELFDEHISENKFEDERIDNNIANINMGMLENGNIKTACSMHNNVKNIPLLDKKMLL